MTRIAARFRQTSFPMKTLATAFALFNLVFLNWAIAESPVAVHGCVVYKRQLDLSASLLEYRAYENLGTNSSVTNVAGEKVRVFPDQNPVFIPYPTDPAAGAETALAQINLARKKYPELARHLAAIEKAWASVPRKSPATVAPVAVVQRPAAEPAKAPEPAKAGGDEYEKLTVSRVEPDGLMVETDTGIRKIPFADLPEKIQKKYGYNPDTAARFAAAVAAAQRRSDVLGLEALKREHDKAAQEARLSLEAATKGKPQPQPVAVPKAAPPSKPPTPGKAVPPTAGTKTKPDPN